MEDVKEEKERKRKRGCKIFLTTGLKTQMHVAHIKISYSTLLRKRWQCVCVCLPNWKLVVVKIKEMREKKEREREGWRDKQTHTSKERERTEEGRRGREGWRGEVLREKTHHLCSGGSNISWLQSDSNASSFSDLFPETVVAWRDHVDLQARFRIRFRRFLLW